ncbi:SCO family protein [Marinobacter nanhaiticus D15-8W]|uniref:SCO family protein n=1 Tax=Marinobacter nanhaiticus D15-8W TaxID=626887 RepID=N6VZZ9_9GAMM|nr:SCO family protein [Marinobacter nanhaiticus]ENO13464.1 SCO family protein [Marinobacter nanhaiticus D15-8W]BES70830.1 SCO family protein [Marinobacter nanhaiticus D15-8W]
MKAYFWRSNTITIPAALTLTVALLLTGCLGNDEEDWNGKNISGLMPELEFDLINSQGDPVSSNDYSGRVRMLFFGFTSCPDVCPTTLQKLNQVTSALSPELQEEVLTLFVSVDPQRDTPERLTEYVDFFGGDIVGLTGEELQLRELAKRYRTTFGYEEPGPDGNYAVSHSSAIYVFDREGNPRLLIRPNLSGEEIRHDLVALIQESS